MLADTMRRLCGSGLTTSTGGNASLRVEGGLLVTPSGIDKLSIDVGDLLLLPVEEPGGGSGEAGEIPAVELPGDTRPSMETGMHLAIYGARPDVRAVIHAHPLMVTAYSASGTEMRLDLTGEARALLGRVTRVGFEMMGSPQLAADVARAAEEADAMILGNHGAVTLGDTLQSAFARMETLETAARISFITSLLGDVRCLCEEDLEKIDILFGRD